MKTTMLLCLTMLTLLEGSIKAQEKKMWTAEQANAWYAKQPWLVGAINWGLVAGKSNTIYQWGKPMPDGAEPELWFHDVFRKDGTPYKKEETDFILQITAKK